jgi:hypothetical protein
MRTAAIIGLIVSIVLPQSVHAALVDPALIPDGDYVVSVEKIVDPKHIIVKMENGIESKLCATGSMTFDPASHVGRMKIFLYKGVVITYKPA